MSKEKFGIFGQQEIERDENGFIERLVITQASGLFAGAPPTEMRINHLVPFNDEKFGKQFTAKLNRKTDLPFYLSKVKIKMIDGAREVEWTDEKLKEVGIETLEEQEHSI